MDVRRVYVEKRSAYAVRAGELRDELISYLGLKQIRSVRILNRYDVEHVSDAVYDESLITVFAEAPLDHYYRDTFPSDPSDVVFSVAYLPGQFDQRADSAKQCISLLDENATPEVKHATTYVISGDLSADEISAIKQYVINPVDSCEVSEEKPKTLESVYDTPQDVMIMEGFCQESDDKLKALYDSLGLAMTYRDFVYIRDYYKDEEHRDPTMTEIRVLDTYWSDHCRHTTFLTELQKVSFTDGAYKEPIMRSYEKYMDARSDVFAGRKDKFVCLMDMALIAMRKLKKDGKLTDLEESDEINACSIVVPLTIDGKSEEWLINFKNETHNHPTEIEPFGGAATCLGGAIRDPLSGRTYVYQAMRVTGAADPTKPLSETLHGKLPQRKIVTGAASGYSSYGNQIGLATGYVKEIYHPNFVAKRMEIGAVMGAAPRADVIRKDSDPGDIIILLGGRTGRDGCGGATGSSKKHTAASIDTCGAEVQKGNAPTERKIQHMFRRPEVSLLIKKCNDFGAGGVSVAIGELAAGLTIDLDKVPKKYAGLDGTEIAISESQERMAVVVDPKDVDTFLKYAHEENLEAICVAEVEKEPRLVMSWRGKTIVDISRAFLDTNGAHQECDVKVVVPTKVGNPWSRPDVDDVREKWLSMMADLNVCSQKGLVEMFDGSIGAGSVMMPYGGKYQLTETQSMVAKVPMLHGKCDAVTMMSYGYDPILSSWSPYHGAIYAIISSVSKIVAAGGDYKKIHFTFQEYFGRMNENPERWSQPFSSLLGAFEAQMRLGLASIGGKDSMSGTFDDIDVPPTLVSFAVDVADESTIITPELKKAGSKLVLMKIPRDQYDLPEYDQLMKNYTCFFEDVKAHRIISAYVVEGEGLAESVTKMALGNKLGVKIEHSIDKRDMFTPGYGDIVAEVPEGLVGSLTIPYTVIGEVKSEPNISYSNLNMGLDELIDSWNSTLEGVFPTHASSDKSPVGSSTYEAKDIYVCKHKVARPKVFIPVLPGTNCEYDSCKAFERAGADARAIVFRNMSGDDIRESVAEYAKAISESQIVMLPGGFSAGDEPEGSAKFFANVLRSETIKEEIEKLLHDRDGLMLGICNGFQALIKLGLLPTGTVCEQTKDMPTLAKNTIGRHVSKMVYTKVVSNKSPWLSQAKLGGIYVNPVSHGEGRFVATDEWLSKLISSGQIATQYVDEFGQPTMDEYWNPNGSYLAIEGITSEDGRILGKMAHSERIGDHVAINIYGEQDMKIFESGVRYFQ